jgi:hypothetical protein
MRKKMVYLSIGAAVLLVLASLSSVIGFSSSQPQNQDNTSPLFAVRTARSTDKLTNMNIRSEYLGKGKIINIFLSSQSTFESQLNKALRIINDNPSLVKRLLEKISDTPQVLTILKNYGISVSEVESYIYQVKDNPEILKEELKNVDFALPIADGPQPMGLDTSSALGCFIVVLALLPLAILIGIVIATITLFTCLNIGGCAETIIEAILAGIVQELKQP